MSLKNSVQQRDLEAALPDTESGFSIDGLEEAVEIYRDEYGIPHIKAASVHDAFFAQGFVHAQDRLWHMEFDRRRAAGRWAEVAGRSGVLLDTLARRAGLASSAQTDYASVNDETRAMFDAYAAGVNAFINTTSSLPVEYEITGITPEPWEPWQSMAVFKVRHILMGTSMAKLLRARVFKAVGPEFAAKLRAESLGDEVLVVPPGAEYVSALNDLSELDAGDDALSQLAELDSGSNNWAVHGSRSASGKPILAGDSHRALDVPNVYYQNHLACPEFNVIGYSFAGLPGFPHFGHSEQVAWCITHAGADYQDLYVERFDPENPAQYEYQGGWREAERRTEQLQVRGEQPVDVDITVTHHGPVVIGDPASGHAISMRYTATDEPNTGFQCLLPMLRAADVDEFDEAMRDWVDPGNNLIYGDVHGNCCYLTRGKVPIRTRANFWLPVPGWTGEHEWQGMIPFEELPRLRNPDTGYIATANNRIVGDNYPYDIAIDYAPPSRAQRIIARLSALQNATADDMQPVHADRLSLPSRIFIENLEGIQPDSKFSAQALDILKQWDRIMAPDSTGAAVYMAMRNELTRMVLNLPVFEPVRNSPYRHQEPPTRTIAGLLWFIVPGLIRENDTSILPEGESWSSVLAQALSRATAWLAEEIGSDPDAWQWGRIHRTAPVHPLAAVEPQLGDRLNPPFVSVGGDSDTPQAAAINPAVNYNVAGTSVTRYIFDTDDWNNSRWIVPLGSSGHPGSPHFADQVDHWANVEYIPMLYDWGVIAKRAETHQRLEPGK